MRSEWNRKNLGLTPEAGARLARTQFGSKLRIRESIEDLHSARLLEEFLHHPQHAVRLFRFSPGLAFTVVATIAAGIAGMPAGWYRWVSRRLWRKMSSSSVPCTYNGEITRRRFFAQRHALELSQTKLVPCAAVQSSFLPTLGVAPALGRNFSPSEDQPQAPRTILISDRVWRGDFDSQTDVIGKPVKLDDGPARIIGVVPANFVLPQGADVDMLLPAQLDERTA
jgi:hypothetical protein